MDYGFLALLAVIVFFAAFTGASLGVRKESPRGEPAAVNPLKPILDKVTKRVQEKQIKEQENVYKNWMYHPKRPEEEE